MTGQRVGSYEIVRVLARGGMAVVYLARQPALERDVALKRVDLDSRDPTIAQRFVREAQLAGALAHPNIVTLYDFLEADGVPYIAMEYISGGSLRPFIASLTRAQVFGVLEGVLAGLDHAEGHRVAHRDLKPENVLVTTRGAVKLADFGIARAYNALTGRLTNTGIAVGTPTYMAPEQALNEDLSPSTDLYAIGVMAFEMLAGRPPFEASDTPLAVLFAHVNQPVPALTGLAPDVPEELCRWVEWLLAKAPSDRPQSAAEASEALERLAVAELGPYWRRQAPIVEPIAQSDTGWTTFAHDTPAAPPAPEPIAEPEPEPVPEPKPLPEPEPPPEPEPIPEPVPIPEPEPPAPEPTPAEPELPPADWSAPTLQPQNVAPESAPTTALPVADEATPTGGVVPARRAGHGRRNVELAAAAVGAIAAVVALLLLRSDDSPSPPPAPAPAAARAAAYDFDGNGRQELVVGVPDAGAGAITVLEPGRRTIDPAAAGLADAGEVRQFGASLASGDFDGDGSADLAIGARDADAVAVLYGSGDGLDTGRKQTFEDDAARYGSALAAGDLNDDGRDDLVIGAPGMGDSGGELQIRFGGTKGLGDAARSIAPPDGAAAGFGARARLGDVNADGTLDIVESGAADRSDEGHTTFCAGSDSGPRSCTSVNSDGGTALAVGDVDGDGAADVVQGDTGPDPAAVAGEVRVLKGGGDGPDPTPLVITQETAAVPGNDQDGDEFGSTVSVARVDGDRFEDIIVGAPGDIIELPGDDEIGRVTVIRGGRDGIAPTGHVRFGLPDTPDGAVFGKAVSVLDVSGDGRELFVAAALAGGVRLAPFSLGSDPLAPGEPIDLELETGPGEPADVSIRLGRDGGG